MSDQFQALTPGDVDRCVRQVLPGEPNYDMLQIVMLGPDLAEVKVRSTVNREWYQGVVKRSEWRAR
jgi:hypothetical protein